MDDNILFGILLHKFTGADPKDCIRIEDYFREYHCLHLPTIKAVPYLPPDNLPDRIDMDVEYVEMNVFGHINRILGAFGRCPKCGKVYYNMRGAK